jgi:hypothetical protein
VTLAAPDEAALALVELLGMGALNVSDAVKLLSCQPVVNTARRCTLTPIAHRATTALSDAHTVAMARVPQFRAVMDIAANPELTPTTVTLVLPDDAAFEAQMLLGPGPSMVSEAVMLLICQPVVSTARRSGQMLAADLATTELSDRHSVVSDREPETRDTLLPLSA